MLREFVPTMELLGMGLSIKQYQKMVGYSMRKAY